MLEKEQQQQQQQGKVTSGHRQVTHMYVYIYMYTYISLSLYIYIYIYIYPARTWTATPQRPKQSASRFGAELSGGEPAWTVCAVVVYVFCLYCCMCVYYVCVVIRCVCLFEPTLTVCLAPVSADSEDASIRKFESSVGDGRLRFKAPFRGGCPPSEIVEKNKTLRVELGGGGLSQAPRSCRGPRRAAARRAGCTLDKTRRGATRRVAIRDENDKERQDPTQSDERLRHDSRRVTWHDVMKCNRSNYDGISCHTVWSSYTLYNSR